MGLGPLQRFPASARNWGLPGALAAVALLFQLSGPAAERVLPYAREAIAGGELWRLISAHVVHLGWPHLALNVAALILIWLLLGAGLRFAEWLLVLAVSASAIDAGFWFLMPELDWYVGMSGVLHGLFAAGAACLWTRHRGEAALLIAVLIAKLAYEIQIGPMPGSEATAGGRVITEAHLFGAIGGTLAVVVLFVLRAGRKAD